MQKVVQFEVKALKGAIEFLKQANRDKLATTSLLVGNGKAKLWTSNRFATYETTISASGTMPIVTIDLAQAFSLLKACKQDSLSFDGIAFYSQHTTLNVKVIPDFHNKELNTDNLVLNPPSELDNKKMVLGVKNLLAASGVSEVSPRNYGTVFYFDSDRIVGTDSFRMAYSYLDLANSNGFSLALQILKAVARFNPSDSTTIQSTDCKSFVLITSGNYRILARTSSVKFPSYSAVIPKLNADFEVENFKDRLKTLISTSGKSQVIGLSTEGELLKLTNKSEAILVPYKGQGQLNMTINGKFLLDAIKKSKEETLYLQFKSGCNSTPLIVGLNSHQTVIVPMTIT